MRINVNFGCQIWVNWANRSDCVWNEGSKSTWQIINDAAVVLAEWRSTHPVTMVVASLDSRSLDKWSVPSTGTWKCNVDATTFMEPNKMGYGGMLWDDKCSFIAAVASMLQDRFSPLIA